MRPISALLVVVFILGGMQVYMTARRQPVAVTPNLVPVAATGDFDLEVSLTFAAGPDEFALNAAKSHALLVQLKGDTVLRREDRVAADEVVSVAAIQGITLGDNEFYLEAIPENPDDAASRALRIRVLRNEQLLGETILWAPPGQVVQGTAVVTVRDTPAFEVAPTR